VCFFNFDAAIEYQACYARENARAAGLATLLLYSDFTTAEKESLLINFVQHGIDLWGMVRAGFRGWPAHGGHGSGRKWPIMFAGLMLGDMAMAAPTKTYPNCRFGEDMQTMHDSCWTGANAVYAGHQGVWNGQPVSSQPTWGPYEHLHPSQWIDSYPGESYRRCCTSIAWVGEALSALILGAKENWNHDAFFDYCDRWMTEDDTEHIKIILAETGANFGAGYLRQRRVWDSMVNQMWAAHRDSLGQSIKDVKPIPAHALVKDIVVQPHPFKDRLSISFSLPSPGKVEIMVMDLKGKALETIISKCLITGPHQVQWDGKGIENGKYLLCITGDSFQETREIIKAGN
jgi:hypothetical protein